MILRKFFSTLTFSTLIATPALANGEPPSPPMELDGKVVSVMPVLTSGPRDAAYQRLSANIANRATKASAVDPMSIVSLNGTSGFGFAGASTDADIAVLQLAFLLGSVPASAGDANQLAQIVAAYDQNRDSLAVLLPEVVAATDKIIAAARTNKVDANALAQAMKHAEEGIGHGPARAHGYFATGLWFGLTLNVIGDPRADESFAAMALPLAVMLEQDAEFGGSDLTLAAEMRKVSAMLASGGVDLDAYTKVLATAFSVGADRQ